MKAFATAAILGLSQAIMLQVSNNDWLEHQGMCLDDDGNQYDEFSTFNVTNGWGNGGKGVSVQQCKADCSATPECVGITFSAGADRCGLRVTDGAVVTLPDYETYNTATDGYVGMGPVASGDPAGDWKCAVNPAFQASTGPQWNEVQGMCLDADGYQYDEYATFNVTNGWGNGGKGVSVTQCKADCSATPECVGITFSAGADRCGLRVTDGAVVTLPDYETYSTATDGYLGMGPVASGAPQGDWMCAINPDFQAQSSGTEWNALQGMCVDSQGNNYDDYEEFGVTNGWGNGGKGISKEECYADCAASNCVGINYSDGAGRCVLRVEDNAVVTLPDYEATQVGYTGVGPVADAMVQGDWMCYINPDFVASSSAGTSGDSGATGAEWDSLNGMCIDAQGNQYDDWEEFGVTNGWGNGGYDISLTECYDDCDATEQCVGINYSHGAGRCVLRVEDNVEVTLLNYEATQVGYAGVGAVKSAAPQGDWMCYINPGFIEVSHDDQGNSDVNAGQSGDNNQSGDNSQSGDNNQSGDNSHQGDNSHSGNNHSGDMTIYNDGSHTHDESSDKPSQNRGAPLVEVNVYG